MYRISIKELFIRFESNQNKGLNEKEVEKRLRKNGLNILLRSKQTTKLELLFRQFKNPLIFILLIAGAISIALGKFIDSGVIFVAIFVNIGIGFFQESRSADIFKSLEKSVKENAFVLREGKIKEISATHLVIGDIILLKAGNKVPADSRLIFARGLEVDETSLTGESIPVKKYANILKKELSLGDRNNTVYMGTVITSGEAKALVVATGNNTEIGQIVFLTQSVFREKTPLQHKISRLGKFIGALVVLSSIGIFILGFFQNMEFSDIFILSVAIAVAAIPEGMPAALSVVLAIGMRKIFKEHGLIKHISASETLGSTTVICTDKTGTLTEGKMKAEIIITKEKEYMAKDNLSKEINCILGFANEAIIENRQGIVIFHGSPTDKAMMKRALDSGFNLKESLEKFPRLAMLQFNRDRKYIASFHKKSYEKIEAFITGAPEIILENSILTNKQKNNLTEKYEAIAKQGFRIIALAKRKFNRNIIAQNARDEELEKQVKKLKFVGFAMIRDSIRASSKNMIEQAEQAGIKVVMVTGDHKLTAKAIAKELGLKIERNSVITGLELDNMPDSELEARIKKISIFARVSPKHKMRIVEMLQKKGEVVAMTGDGVNDTPAIKKSDIGIAFNSGTDISKEAADLVLLDNSFSAIVHAIRQGRVAFSNIRKTVIYLLTDSFTEVFLIVVALIFHTPLPILAVQILWINLIETSLPNFALAFEHGEKGIMKQKPIKKYESILNSESKFIIFAIGGISSIILILAFLWLYYILKLDLIIVQTFVFATLGTNSLLYIFSIKALRTPLFKTRIFDNKYLLIAVGIGFSALFASIYAPFLNTFLHTIPISFNLIILVFAIGLIEVILIELSKWAFNNKRVEFVKTN